jgi:rRNA maturation endonuclease Nob1
MEIVVMLLLVGVVGAMILGPLVKRSETVPPAAGSDAAAAGPQRADVLADLEFDHATGKLSDDDYESLRAQIQAAEPAAPVPAVRTSTDGMLDSLEAEIRAARARRRFCTGCGAVLSKAARFCPACGTPVPPRTAEGRA